MEDCLQCRCIFWIFLKQIHAGATLYTCQTTIFPLTVCRLLPAPGSGLLFGLLFWLVWFIFAFLWCSSGILGMLFGPCTPHVVSWCLCTSVSTNQHESVVFISMRLIWSLASQILHYTRQWSHTHTLTDLKPSSVNKVLFCPRLQMWVCKHTYGFPCVCWPRL